MPDISTRFSLPHGWNCFHQPPAVYKLHAGVVEEEVCKKLRGLGMTESALPSRAFSFLQRLKKGFLSICNSLLLLSAIAVLTEQPACKTSIMWRYSAGPPCLGWIFWLCRLCSSLTKTGKELGLSLCLSIFPLFLIFDLSLSLRSYKTASSPVYWLVSFHSFCSIAQISSPCLEHAFRLS